MRGAPCGSTRFVAEGLATIAVDDAEYEAGMLHAHFPCLASMAAVQVDAVLRDTLMHVSGYVVRDEVGEQIRGLRVERRWCRLCTFYLGLFGSIKVRRVRSVRGSPEKN